MPPKKMLIPLLFAIAFAVLYPAAGRADCTDLSSFTAWVLQDDGSVIFYRGHRVLGNITLADCTVQPASYIALLKNYVCDTDHIQVDGTNCTIMTVRGTASGY
ncbi:MAG TPA: hypothetical protein VLS90_16310 [Thermodesulfobacteriota bacterium]|nr:hypothetical protein [Thermodesulfobacteriota bacterium]